MSTCLVKQSMNRSQTYVTKPDVRQNNNIPTHTGTRIQKCLCLLNQVVHKPCSLSL